MHITIHLLKQDFYGPKEISKQPSNCLTCLAVPIQYREWLKEEKLPSIQRDSIYFLVGSNNNDENMVYVGVTTQADKRINKHMNDREWIEDVLIFELAENHGESVLKYIERHLIGKVEANLLRKSDNGNSGSSVNMSAMGQDMCDEILKEIEMILDASGYNFLKPPIGSNEYEGSKEGLIECSIDIGDQHAKGVFDGKRLTVLVGSTARIGWGESNSSTSINSKERTTILVDKLLSESILKADEKRGVYVFEKDYEFSSATQAAHLILGYHCSGIDKRGL